VGNSATTSFYHDVWHDSTIFAYIFSHLFTKIMKPFTTWDDVLQYVWGLRKPIRLFFLSIIAIFCWEV
jgi:hypothetical protein